MSCSVLWSGNPEFSPLLSTQAVSLSDWQPQKVNKLLRGIRWTGDGQRPISPYSLFFSVLSTYCLTWLHCHNPRGELLTLRRENELPGPSGWWGGGVGNTKKCWGRQKASRTENTERKRNWGFDCVWPWICKCVCIKRERTKSVSVFL